MSDSRAATENDKKPDAGTTSGASSAAHDAAGHDTGGHDKSIKPVDKAASPPPGDASNTLLDSSLDADYQRMVQARKSDGGQAAAPADTTLLQKGILAPLTVDHHAPGKTAVAPGDRTTKPEVTAQGDGHVEDKARQQRLAYLQATVQNYLPVVLAPDKGEPDAALQKNIESKQAAIKQEAARGEFGPATRAAYGQYVDWLEKSAIPSETRDLKMFQLAIDQPGAKAPTADLKINRADVPDETQLHRLDDAVKWAQNADYRVQEAKQTLLKKFDANFADTVNKMGLPKGWLQDINQDHARWRQTVAPLISNALTVKSNLEILDEVNKAGGNRSVESVLPPGARVERDQDGNLKNVHLDLPRTWDMNNPDNKAKADKLDAMLAETNALLAPAVPQLRTAASRPELALNWGDTEMSGMKGKFDGKGNFLGMVKKDATPNANEHLEDVNLLESRFNIEEKNGKIVVHQHIQAQDVPWWGYQNLIGVKNIGNGIDITKSYNPNDNVVIRTPSGMEVKQAKDLASYRNWQMVKHYGEKGLMGVLDGGMCVTGLIELGAAFKAARVAEVGFVGLDVLGRGAAKNVLLAEGTEVTGGLLAKQAGKGLLRTTVGVTGLLNNAGARESNLGAGINYARSAYFLGDASIGLGVKGLGAVKSVLGVAPEAGLGASKLTLAGLTAGSKAENIYKLSHGVFKVSEYGFIPIVGDDLYHAIGKTHNDKDLHVKRAAITVIHDRGLGDDKQ